MPLVTAGILGDIFGTIGHAVLGAFSWTIGLASKFILTTIGALVRMLIPRSWANEGVQIMEWIVAIPNYAGTVTSPTGHTIYGFAGINGLRDLFTWIGVGLLPLTLVYGTTRAMLGERGHVAVPIARVVAIAALLVSYPYWWTEAAAMTDTVTHMVLTLPAVVTGLHKLMLYAVDGVALGGWQLVDLALMALVAIELLSLIFLKVVLILLGALLYATGPITIGLVATDSGAGDRARVGVGCGAAARGAGGLGDPVRGRGAARRRCRHGGTADRGEQLGRLAARRRAARGRRRRVAVDVPARRARGDGTAPDAARRAAGAQPPRFWRQACARRHRSRAASSSLRRFGARVAQAAGGAGGELAAAGAGGAAVVRGGRAVGYVARHGALGTAAAGGRAAAASGWSARLGARGPLPSRSRRRANGEGRDRGLVRTPSRQAGRLRDPPRTAPPASRAGGRRLAADQTAGARRQPASSGGASAPSAARAASGSPSRGPGQTRPAAQRDARAFSDTSRCAYPALRLSKRPPRPATSPKPASSATSTQPPPPPRSDNRPGRGKR